MEKFYAFDSLKTDKPGPTDQPNYIVASLLTCKTMSIPNKMKLKILK